MSGKSGMPYFVDIETISKVLNFKHTNYTDNTDIHGLYIIYHPRLIASFASSWKQSPVQRRLVN